MTAFGNVLELLEIFFEFAIALGFVLPCTLIAVITVAKYLTFSLFIEAGVEQNLCLFPMLIS